MFSIFYQSLSNASRTAHPLTAANRLVFLVGLCLGVARLYGQPSATPDPRFWAPDGPVNAILITNNTMYLGGDFLYVGPRTGPAAVFDQANGNLLAAPARINGTVRAVVPDGNGGWFIGGSFANIGVTPITNVAHLNADLSLDPRWNALISGTAVNALQLDGNRLYIGGQYTRIGGQVRGNLAAVNASNGSLVTTWDPQVGGSVNALRVAGSLIYVGGNFFNVGNSNNTYLAAISTATSLATGWRPDSGMQAQVFALEISGNTVYIGGGDFTTIGTRSRHYLAAIDATTGVGTTWDPNPNGVVRAIAVVGTTAYIGGDFTTIAIANRRGFAAVPTSGQGRPALPLDLQLQSVGTANLIRSFLVQSNSLYVGGSFTNALGAQHPVIAGVDITSGSAVPVPLGTEFNGSAGTPFGANALAGANGVVFIGGDFQSVGGVARQRAAALSLTTGAVLPWAPAFSAPVTSFAYGANGIYVGGSFSNLNTTNIVQGLAAVNPVSGDPIPTFNFQGSAQFAGVSVGALAIRSNSLFVGGSFTAVGALQRRFLAAVDTTSGNAFTNFDAKLGGGSAGVSALAVAGTNLYLGGDFTTVNAVSFPRLAGVSATTGAPLSWPNAPSPNQPVMTLSATADNLYVGGLFTTIGGITLRNFAAFSLADRSLVPVDASLPTFAQGVNAISATPTTLYVGGSFDSIGGEFRLNLGCLSFTGAAYEWDPAPDQPSTVIALTDQYVAVGGPFRSLGRSPTNQVNGFLAVFNRTPRILRTTLTAANTISIQATSGDRTDVVLQATPDIESPNWVNITTNDIPGFSWTTEVPVGANPQRFFRAVAR